MAGRAVSPETGRWKCVCQLADKCGDTTQASVAGKSKSDFIQELVSVSFGILIATFSRCSGLVVLIDREVSHCRH
ncbi:MULTISPECIES: hypothetical protein [Citrobacter]|uniref:Uncharacterized protein n=1 Tax=Citrobacter cronae TaxID=1748967 RepID=A0A7X1BM61_9ENTR|nr:MULTISPECIES: hypothetical protein [Citrobacter]MBC2618982.1 hypothetical protein [Citrobacter cronae]MDM3301278.1 hypothetical protein [Citrobacter sp. Cc227]HCD7429012.1 hypothetical protein [Citrobacter werkmanii]